MALLRMPNTCRRSSSVGKNLLAPLRLETPVATGIELGLGEPPRFRSR